MRKFSLSLLCCMMLVISSFVLMACGDDDKNKYPQFSSNLTTTYKSTDTIDFSAFTLTVKKSKSETVTVKAADVEFDIEVKNAKSTTKYVVTTKAQTTGIEPLSKQTAGSYVAGKYDVKVIVVSDSKEYALCTITVNSAQVDVVTFTAPTAVANLVYTGGSLNLVNAGSSQEGTFTYSLSEDEEFASAIPTATNAGDYTVYYRVTPNEGVSKTQASGSVNVSIAKREIRLEVTSVQEVSKTDYDVNSIDLSLVGVVGSDDVSCEITSEIDLNSTETQTLNIALIGEDAGNYELVQQTVSVLVVSSTKKTPSFSRAPEGKQGLTYNGNTLELINAGVVDTRCPGSFSYSLTENGEFASAIPTATDANNYTVYYKFTPNDTDEYLTVKRSILVTISKLTYSTYGVDFGNTDFTYNGQDQSAGVGVTGWTHGDTQVSFSKRAGSSTEFKTAGLYDVTITFTTNDNPTNCNLPAPLQKTLEIKQKEVTLAETTFEYTTENVTQPVLVINSGVVEGDNVTAVVKDWQAVDGENEFDVVLGGTDQVNYRLAADSSKIIVIVNYVVEEGDRVVAFMAPKFINDYLDRNAISEENATSEAKFYNAATYTVGDDNEFFVKPELIIFDNGPVTKTNFSVDLQMQIKNPSTDSFEDAIGYYTFDEFTYGMKFNETGDKIATGNTFRLTMTVHGCEFDMNGLSIEPITLEFKVADGWNAYTALDLGRMNIMSDSMTDELYATYLENAVNDQSRIWLDGSNVRNQSMNYSNLWKNFIANKTGVSVSEVKHINGLFIHGDIAITTADIPTEYFITSQEIPDANYNASVGSLRDGSQLYNYYMENDFVMNGNLFTVDFSQVPLCLNNKDSSTGSNYYYTANQATFFPSHTAAFAFMEKKTVKEDYDPSWNQELLNTPHVANILNFNMIGNSIPNIVTLAEDASTQQKFEVLQYSGGLIGVKSFSTTTNISNCISNRFMISWYSDNLGSKYNATTLNYCKTYDSFNSGFFSFRATNNFVNNSEFKRFGGPAMLLICGDPQYSGTSNGPKHCSEMTVDTNTVIESYVTGQEPWFVMMNSTTTVTTIKVMVDPLVGAYGNNTIITDNKLNLKVLIMMDDYLNADVPAYGKFTQGDFVLNTEPSETNPVYLIPWGTGAPVFVDAAGHCAAYNGTKLINPDQSDFTQGFTGSLIGFNYNMTQEAQHAPVLGLVFEMKPASK